MTVWIPLLYKDNKSVFLDFISKTDQKEVTAQVVLDFLLLMCPVGGRLVITDIGAGSGVIASKVLSQVGDTREVLYHFIEPARELIDEFRSEHAYENVVYINDIAENVNLPKSDIIIASFVFQAIRDKDCLLQRMYEALNPGWVIIIVNQNPKTLDSALKNLFGYAFIDLTSILCAKLDVLGIKAVVETKKSSFYGVDDILRLTEVGKNCLSFLLFKRFEYITPKELATVTDYIRKKERDGKLVRLEDYISIRK